MCRNTLFLIDVSMDFYVNAFLRFFLLLGRFFVIFRRFFVIFRRFFVIFRRTLENDFVKIMKSELLGGAPPSLGTPDTGVGGFGAQIIS